MLGSLPSQGAELLQELCSLMWQFRIRSLEYEEISSYCLLSIGDIRDSKVVCWKINVSDYADLDDGRTTVPQGHGH